MVGTTLSTIGLIVFILGNIIWIWAWIKAYLAAQNSPIQKGKDHSAIRYKPAFAIMAAGALLLFLGWWIR
jgi:hypothetical protein